jgi:hypothetical protein
MPKVPYHDGAIRVKPGFCGALSLKATSSLYPILTTANVKGYIVICVTRHTSAQGRYNGTLDVPTTSPSHRMSPSRCPPLPTIMHRAPSQVRMMHTPPQSRPNLMIVPRLFGATYAWHCVFRENRQLLTKTPRSISTPTKPLDLIVPSAGMLLKSARDRDLISAIQTLQLSRNPMTSTVKPVVKSSQPGSRWKSTQRSAVSPNPPTRAPSVHQLQSPLPLLRVPDSAVKPARFGSSPLRTHIYGPKFTSTSVSLWGCTIAYHAKNHSSPRLVYPITS